MQQFLRIVGILISTGIIRKTFNIVGNLSNQAKLFADKLEKIEQNLKENE